MKNLMMLALFMTATQAFADQPLKIFGSGTMNRSTKQTLALVCVGEGNFLPTTEAQGCPLVRFGLFQSGSDQVELIGPSLRVPRAGPDQYRKEAVEIEIRNYFKFHIGGNISSNSSATFTANEGWNWSTDADRVSDKKFSYWVESLKEFPAGAAEFMLLPAKTTKRLEAKGVIFY